MVAPGAGEIGSGDVFRGGCGPGRSGREGSASLSLPGPPRLICREGRAGLKLMSQTEFRHLVRIAGRDLEGSKSLIAALSDLRGVGYNFGRTVVAKLEMDPRIRLGTLSEDQVKEIEKALQGTASAGLPQWYYNRRKDPETGETKQLLGSDLDFAIKNDIDRERNVQSWRGIRHSLGLKVRGQRTRTTGRHGKTVGVRKAALQAAAKEAAKKGEEEKK